jgi:hypothetical protein
MIHGCVLRRRRPSTSPSVSGASSAIEIGVKHGQLVAPTLTSTVKVVRNQAALPTSTSRTNLGVCETVWSPQRRDGSLDPLLPAAV